MPIGPVRALSAYYGSQLLNVALPGGILGDAHRAVQHGRAAGDLSRAIRATVWKRFAGKVVQTLLMLAALAVIPTAWAFATVGLPAATGVTVAVLYGVLGTLSALPGVVVLVVQARRRRALDPR